MAPKHAGPHDELAEEDGEGGGPGEGTGVPVGPLHAPRGHAHFPDLGHAPGADCALDDDGDEAADHDQGLEEVRPDHGFQATLQKKEKTKCLSVSRKNLQYRKTYRSHLGMQYLCRNLVWLSNHSYYILVYT